MNLMKIPFEIENITVAKINAVEYECIAHLLPDSLIHYIESKAAIVNFIFFAFI